MKIEQYIYGMQTDNGKIEKIRSPGVNTLLTLKSQELLRTLKVADSRKYLWFPTEQTIAYPIIIEVADKDPKHGGRTWVQNRTFLMSVHDFFTAAQHGQNPFSIFEENYTGELGIFPEVLNAINV